MSDRTFLDTNILVKAYDQHDPIKQNKAQGLITAGIEQETLVLSCAGIERQMLHYEKLFDKMYIILFNDCLKGGYL